MSKTSRIIRKALEWANFLRTISKKSSVDKHKSWIDALDSMAKDVKFCPASAIVARDLLRDIKEDSTRPGYASRIRLLAHDMEGEAYRNAYVYWTAIEARRLGRSRTKILG